MRWALFDLGGTLLGAVLPMSESCRSFVSQFMAEHRRYELFTSCFKARNEKPRTRRGFCLWLSEPKDGG
jgi:hypothetical protein